MATLLTGASGFLGTALTRLLLAKGYKVYGLSRHPPAPAKNLIPLEGDILKPNLGLDRVPGEISAVHHLAAIHQLGEDKDGLIWKTNVDGTKNVIDFCIRHDIPHLYFCSTAYTLGRNTYERSKVLCEELVKQSKIPRLTIFKPSVVMGTEQHFYPGHFGQLVLLLIRIHQRAELVRRKIEGSLRLPVLEPVFRIRGKPDGKLNLVQIDQVVWGMSNIEGTGTFWLTNPAPSTLQQLCDWVGEYIMVRLKVEPKKFKPTPLEFTFRKIAAPFKHYLLGDDFPSDLKDCPQITREFIHDTIRRTLLSKS